MVELVTQQGGAAVDLLAGPHDAAQRAVCGRHPPGVLQREGTVCGRRRIARLMRAAGLAGQHRRRRRRTTTTAPHHDPCPARGDPPGRGPA
ncbi:IS3 family transposase [Streptomyces sp. NPDC056188]|uniref:IS3 family transposase n=1 Tax=Streptomyces sp. NPDC056188 TaxID=3345740 RepID=UPI0035E0737C